jgi:O-antigen/teichoic acid export membrane protein
LLGLRVAITSLSVALAAVLLAGVATDGGTVAAGVALSGVGIVLMVVQGAFQVPLLATLRLGTAAGLDVARAGLQTAGFAVLASAGAGLLSFLSVAIPVNAVLLVVTVLLVKGTVPLRPSFSRTEWLALVRPGIAFSLATAVGIVYQYGAQILTAAVASPEESGWFAAAFRVFILMGTVPAVLVSSAFPLLSRAARDDARRLAAALHGVLSVTLLLGGAAALGCTLAAGPIIDVAAGRDRYEPAVGVLQVQGVVLLITFVIAAWGYTLLALHRHRSMVWANAAAFLVSLCSVIPLAAAHGAQGAAYGTLIGESVLALGYGLSLARFDRELRPRWSAVVRVGIALVPAFAIALIPGLSDIATTGLALAVYATAAWFTGAVPAELVNHLLPGALTPQRAGSASRWKILKRR